MTTKRFFKLIPSALLALLAFYSLAAQAGTIAVSPTTADAGTTGVGVVSDTRLYYTITNTGNTNLSITGVTGTSEFLIYQPTPTVLPLTIAPGGSSLVVVLFKPSAAGIRSGSITITSNDPVKPTTLVTATGYGGIEKSIRLTPLTPFELELGQGVGLRANVTFDNNTIGVALLNWTSSNTAVATAVVGDTNASFGTSVPTGKVSSVGLGTATITVAGIQAPAVKASVAITVVAATPHEFMGTAASDRVVRVKNGVWSLCYDFPEADIQNRPVYDTNQIGVTTPSLNTIGNVYVTADNTASLDDSEQAFYLTNCSLRTAVFDQPLSSASFRDLVVESTSNAVVSNSFSSDLWQLTPTTSSPIARTGLPPDDIGALAIDSFDNLYMANLIKTSTMQTAAVYVRPFGSTTWFPVAAVFNTVNPSSAGIPGMAAIFEGNKGYAMKTVDYDKTVVERYVDLNGDMSFYKIVGTTIVADPGEIVEVELVDAGVDITVDSNRNLIVSVADQLGRTLFRMTDKNNDGDFKDANEARVIYQSTLFTQLKDVAFAAPCRDRPPTAVISTLPPSGVIDLNTPIYFLGSASTDPCQDPLTYSWTNEDMTTPPVVCTTSNCQMTYTGLPALHKMGLIVKDPAGNVSSKTIKTVKAGPPALSGFWPSSGVTTTAVFLFGRNFQMAPGTLPAYPVVKFNNGTLLAPISQAVATDLLFVLQPAGVTEGKITVDTAIGSTVTTANFNAPITPGVKINGFWHVEAKVGEIVFVFGQNFSTLQGGNKVTLNGLSAPIVQPLEPSIMLFMVPPGATSGPVCNTVAGSPVACSSTNLVVIP